MKTVSLTLWSIHTIHYAPPTHTHTFRMCHITCRMNLLLFVRTGTCSITQSRSNGRTAATFNALRHFMALKGGNIFLYFFFYRHFSFSALLRGTATLTLVVLDFITTVYRSRKVKNNKTFPYISTLSTLIPQRSVASSRVD